MGWQDSGLLHLFDGKDMLLKCGPPYDKMCNHVFGEIKENETWFQWKQEALLFLDTYIFEIYDVLN